MKKTKATSSYALMEDIQSKSRRNTIFSSLFIVAGLVVAAMGFIFAEKQRSVVYVVDGQGVAGPARVAAKGERKDLEINTHLTRFHSLMFTIIPSAELIEQNVETALNLADQSAYNYYSDLKEQQFYSRLVKTNTSQEIVLDSIRCNTSTYPYVAEVFAKVYVARPSNIAKYDFHSTCRLTDVGRSVANPNGLRIELFNVDRYQQLEVRQRR